MAFSKLSLASIAAVLGLAPGALAGFSSSSSSNVAIYWGQNSAGGASTQERLSYYCSNTEFDVVLLAFMDAINSPTINFASATNACTAISGTNLYTCPEIEADIVTCQQTYGKTVMLSIGGATYSEGGFTSQSAAETAATNVWGLFGSNTAYSNRPFGSAVVDGFDFDFESTTSNMQYFANKLRSLMDADTSKTYYLSAAPQCPYPDSADNSMLDGSTSFDFINVQFYNNYCELSNFVVGSSTQNNFNFGTWDTWASSTSANKDVKVLVGAPASTGAAGAGYVAPDELAEIISFCKSYSSFGGVMFWDMSQLWTNTGMLDTTYTALGGSSSGGSGTTTTTAKATTTTKATSTTTTKATTTTTSSSGSTTGVAQWGQCGGEGYTGSTVCASPYTCVETSVWWSQCE